MWNRGPYCSIVLSTVDKRPLLFYVHGLNEIHAHTHTHTHTHTHIQTRLDLTTDDSYCYTPLYSPP